MRTQIQNINDNVRLNQWQRIILECWSSKLLVKKWCRQNNVSEPSYYCYLKKIRQSILEEDGGSQSFVPIVLKDESVKKDPELIEIIKGDIKDNSLEL